MAKQILCPDGITRSNKEYRKWIKFLKEVFKQEPNDLTPAEIIALATQLKL